jgi:putative ABC transport system permease protein
MIGNILHLAFRELRRNILRSALTILGIVIGVAAVIVMVTLGKGTTRQVTAEITSLGSNQLQVRPGERFRPGGVRTTAEQFEMADVEAIEREISGISAVAPIASKTLLTVYGNTNWRTSVLGSDNNFFLAREWDVETGREFTESEVRAGKLVCIIGKTVRDNLFGNQDPINATVRLGKLSCEIIGVLSSKGQSAFGHDQDDIVVVPIRAYQRRIAGNRDVNTIYITAQSGDLIDKVKLDVEALMRQRRNISANDEDNFYVRDIREITERVTSTTETLTALLAAVAAVSLLVGGIGIMNIMLVSVTERTREIGIRLAVGAMERDVLRQFLVEAVVLASIGGIVGIALGLTASALTSPLLNVPFVFDATITAVSFVFSAIVGVVFGYFPARKAARLNPIDALRHE